MDERYAEILSAKCGKENYEKLTQLENPELDSFVAKYVELCNPSSVFVRTDSLEDVRYIREEAKKLGEEASLGIDGHTIHFDGYFDQARDKENTKFLVTKELDLGRGINSIPRREGLDEIQRLLKNIMQAKKMFVLFLSLGPVKLIQKISSIGLPMKCSNGKGLV